MNTDLLERMYQTMMTIRVFDERIAYLAKENLIPGYAHTGFGSEAVATGVMMALEPEDWICSTYRNHAHAIAKGALMKAVAERGMFSHGEAVRILHLQFWPCRYG